MSVSIDNEDSRVPSLGGDVGKNSLEKYGLSFGKLNILDEHGLIISNYKTWRDYVNCIGRILQPNPLLLYRIPFKYQGRFWVLIPSPDRTGGNALKLSGVALTQSGTELLKVVDVDSVNDYTQNLMDFFKKEGLQMTETASGDPQVLTQS